MKFGTVWFSRMLILNSTIVFTNSVSKIPYLCNFGPETSKCFGLSETRYSEDFKDGDSGFDNSFLKFHSQISFSGHIWYQIFKVLWFKWNWINRSFNRCFFLIWKLFSSIPSQNAFLCLNFVPKLQSILFWMKLGSWRCPRVLILIWVRQSFFFKFSPQKIFFGKIWSRNYKRGT